MQSAGKHTRKASTPAKQKQWASTANAVLKKSGDEGKAVRIANAAVKKKAAKEEDFTDSGVGCIDCLDSAKPTKKKLKK
jgi:hypothetical protein